LLKSFLPEHNTHHQFPLDVSQVSVTNFWGPKENIPEEVMQKKVDAETSNLDAYGLV
jgi:hypothetical protein